MKVILKVVSDICRIKSVLFKGVMKVFIIKISLFPWHKGGQKQQQKTKTLISASSIGQIIILKGQFTPNSKIQILPHTSSGTDPSRLFGCDLQSFGDVWP